MERADNRKSQTERDTFLSSQKNNSGKTISFHFCKYPRAGSKV